LYAKDGTIASRNDPAQMTLHSQQTNHKGNRNKVSSFNYFNPSNCITGRVASFQDSTGNGKPDTYEEKDARHK
jgi:hypothetical protein